MAQQFLDTNVLLRHLTADHAVHSARASAYLGRIELGEVTVRITDTMVFEVVFALERHYHHPKQAIREAFLPLIELPGVVLPGKRRYRKVFDFYVRLNLPFADACHAVTMEHLKINEIVTFDRDFDRVPGLRRIEP